MGRSLSQDPIGFAGGDANLYRYVGNNPVDSIDPTGLCDNFICDIAGGAKDRFIDWGGSAAGWLKDNVVPLARDFVPGFDLGWNVGTVVRGGHVSPMDWAFSLIGAIPGEGTVARLGGRVAVNRVAAVTREGGEMARVGRWMSPDEYTAMNKTKQVQVDGGGTTHVAYPASPHAFGPQAKPASVYVEFDVPSASLYPAGRADWAQIPSPEHILGRLAERRGNPLQSPVPACNIVAVASC